MYHLIVYIDNLPTKGVYILDEIRKECDIGSIVFGKIIKVLKPHPNQKAHNGESEIDTMEEWNFFRHRIKASGTDLKELTELAYLELL